MIHRFEYRSAVTCLKLTANERHLLVGLKDGKLLIETPETPTTINSPNLSSSTSSNTQSPISSNTQSPTSSPLLEENKN